MSAISFGPVMAELEHALDLRSTRHAMVAANIANADTPGYHPMDIAFEDAMRAASDKIEAGRLPLERTNGAHLATAAGPNDPLPLLDVSSGAAGPDGNTVGLEREVARLEENSLLYEATIEAASRKMAMLRYAASDGGR